MTDTTPRAPEQAVTHALRRTNSTQGSNMNLQNGWELRLQWQDGLDYIVGADGRVKAVLPPTVLPDIAAVLTAAALEVNQCSAPAAETDATSSGAPTAIPRRPMVDSSDLEAVRSPQSGDDRVWRYARAMADADDEDMYEWMREYGRRARAAMKVADAEIAETLARALPSAAGVPVEIDYTNHKGLRAVRTIVPTGRLLPGDDRYHPTASWVIEAFDPEKDALRTFDPMHLHRYGDQVRRPAVATFRAGLAALRSSGFDLGADQIDSALASGAQAGAAGDRPGAAPVDISSDAFAYHDDVTPEGIAAIRARAGELRPARDWRVVEGVAPAGGLPGVEEIAEALASDLATATRYRLGRSYSDAEHVDIMGAVQEAVETSSAFPTAVAAIRARLSAAGTGDAGRSSTAAKIIAGLDDIAAGRFDVVRVATPDPGARPEAAARPTAADGLREALRNIVAMYDDQLGLWSEADKVATLREARAALDAAPSADRGEAGEIAYAVTDFDRLEGGMFYDEADALTCADRIAKRHPGNTIHVLRTVAWRRTDRPTSRQEQIP